MTGDFLQSSPLPGKLARVQFAAPASALKGDQLIVIIAHDSSLAPDAVYSATDGVEWEFSDMFLGDTSAFLVRVFRRVVTDDEPATYTFDADGLEMTVGALLVYRNVDRAALLGGSVDDFLATQFLSCPQRTFARPSDLFLGGVFLKNVGGVTTAAPFDTLGTSTKRFDATTSIGAVAVRRLMIFDKRLPAIGNVGAGVANGAASDGASFSFALACSPIVGDREYFSPIVAGAIGLPVEGI